MLNDKQVIKISKFLSLVLRHQPESIGIVLDENGWTDVETLLEKANIAGVRLDRETLNYIVETNNKKRFSFHETQDKIRANQGHSIEVELGYEAQEPPNLLFHGTTITYVNSILKTGLQKRNRHHVHLSQEIDTALKVGQRHGKPFIFQVAARQMYQDGFEFYLSVNGVWLTDHVPVKYLSPFSGTIEQ